MKRPSFNTPIGVTILNGQLEFEARNRAGNVSKVTLKRGDGLYFKHIPEDLCKKYTISGAGTAQIVHDFQLMFGTVMVPLADFVGTATIIILETDYTSRMYVS